MISKFDRPEILVVVAVLALISSTVWVGLSPGLVTGFDRSGGPKFNTELQSSGSDDHVLLYLAAPMLVVALPFFLWPFNGRANMPKLSLLTCIAGLQGFVAFATPEVGSVALTLRTGANWGVAVWVSVLLGGPAIAWVVQVRQWQRSGNHAA